MTVAYNCNRKEHNQMANKSNKNINNNAPTQNGNAGLDKPVFVPEKDTNKPSVPSVAAYEYSNVQIKAMHKLHAEWNKDSKPMTLDAVVRKVVSNALATQFKAAFVAQPLAKYNAYKADCAAEKRTPISERAYLERHCKSDVLALYDELETTRVK